MVSKKKFAWLDDPELAGALDDTQFVPTEVSPRLSPVERKKDEYMPMMELVKTR
jgi:hypothetical protein